MRPKPNESESAFLDRCVSEMVDSGEFDDEDEAEIVCSDFWNRERGKGNKAMVTIYKTHASNSGGNEYVLSDGSVDRMGDIIEPSGWILDGFKRNPIALFAHDTKLPVGTWENVRVEGGELRGRLKLAPKSASPRIAELHALVDAKILRAVSVGFRAIASEPRKDGDGLRFTKQSLVEVSLVSIPANENALAVAKSLRISEQTRRLVFAKPTGADLGARRRAAQDEFDRASGRIKIEVDKLKQLLKEREQASCPPPQGWGVGAVTEREREERKYVARHDLRQAQILDLNIDAQRGRVALAERQLCNASDALAALDKGGRR
jgi:HK97 family phage prohead protease